MKLLRQDDTVILEHPTLSKEALVKQAIAKNLSLEGAQLDGLNLSNLNYENLDFSLSSLKGTNFSNCTLERSNFYGADLTGANFSSASLKHSSFIDSWCTGVDFENADLSNCNFQSANLWRSSFVDADDLKYILFDSETILPNFEVWLHYPRSVATLVLMLNSFIEHIPLAKRDVHLLECLPGFLIEAVIQFEVLVHFNILTPTKCPILKEYFHYDALAKNRSGV